MSFTEVKCMGVWVYGYITDLLIVESAAYLSDQMETITICISGLG